MGPGQEERPDSGRKTSKLRASIGHQWGTWWKIMGTSWDHHYLVFFTYISLKAGWWLRTFLFFSHHIGNVVIPTDEVIFFRGAGIPPTRLLLTIINHTLTTSEGLKPPTSKGITLRKWCARLSKNAVSPGDDSAIWWAHKRCRGPRTLRKLGFMVSIL